MSEYQKEYLVSVGERPWGEYKVLLNGEDHKVKEITVKPGQRLSLQRHQKREEHWFIHKGEALVTINGVEHKLSVGQYIDIPRQCVHRIANLGDTPLVFIEIQTGDYFGEDDIERLEDDYLR
ncbi:Mannose-1-phosphate guanylyltransferase (GDP) [hydrothermal vent metagenome]|uniref:Mannose-1-phosphate guanylyltransferase (GDP) n=1 Tax=hydrothermal vent metagenome TaxID=652676 RepID=A0A3B1DP40_9ZZZZ